MGDVGPHELFASTEIKSSEDKEGRSLNKMDVVDTGVENSLTDLELYYPMRRGGLFVIFNHETFHSDTLPSRKGTENDVEVLKDVWEKLGFVVKVHHDLTKDGVEEKISSYTQTNFHNKYDCFACAFLTHGEKDDYLFASNCKYKLHDIIEKIKHCDSLIGKPKLFFVQACRGRKLDAGKRSKVFGDTVDAALDPAEPEEIKIPTESDILIMYSTVEEHFAWRNQEKGSWFIQNLADCLKAYAHKMELLQILTLVNMKVGRCKSATDDKAYCGKKQSPSIVSRLTRLIKFETIHTKSERFSDAMDNSQNPKAPFFSIGSSVSVFGETETKKQDKTEYYEKKLLILRKKEEIVKMERELCEMKLNVCQ